MKTQIPRFNDWAILEASLDCIIIVDDQGRVLEFNPAAEKTFKYSSKDVKGKNIIKLLIPPGFRKAHEKSFQRCRDSKGSTFLGKRHEMTAMRSDGAKLSIEMAIQMIQLEGRNIFTAYIRDISERKQTETDLRFQSQMLDSVQDAVITTDLNMRIVYFGKGAEKLYGYTADEVKGRLISNILETGGKKNELERMRHVLETGAWNGQCVQHRKDGSALWVETHLSLVKNNEGKPCGYIGIDRDVTETRRTQMQLKIVNSIALSIRADISIKQVVESTLFHLHREFPSLRVAYSTVDEQNRMEVIQSIAPENMHSINGVKYDLNQAPLYLKELLTGKTIIIENIKEDKRIQPLAEVFLSVQSQALLLFPLRHSDRLISVLWLDASQPKSWCHYEIGIIQEVANYLTLAIRDVETQEALRESEMRATTAQTQLTEAIESLTEAFALYDAEDRLVLWNSKYKEFYDLSADILVPGVKFGDHIRTSAYRGQVAEAIGREEEWLRERIEQHLNPQGPYFQQLGNGRWLQISERKTKDGGIVGVRTDITELKQSNEKYRELVENINDAFFTLDEAGKITYISPIIETISGFKPEECIGRHFAEFVYQEDLPMLQESFERVLSDDLQPTEYRIRTKSGKVRWVCSSSRPILQNGRAIGLRGIMADIHAKKQAEQEHEKLEAQVQYTQKLESLGILAGGIAHDFNNLLTGILGNASLSLMELPPSSPARECLEDIEKASQRAAELCRQMLAYSGKGQFVVEAVNLSEIVKDIANLLEVSISKKASLRYHFASELPAIEADSTQLRQVIMNLITNASDAIGDKAGVIKITTGTLECDDDFFSETILAENHKPGKYVFVEISDTGCGMDNETQSKIFDPFFTTKFTGRGLGLAAVLGIVRGHKGAIKIDSQQGAGTTFKVFFPCTNGCIKSPKPTFATTETWQGEGTILVVDDEKTVRETSRRILEHIGFQVVTVTDGLEAVDYFQEHFREIKAVLLDMTMPNLNGEETFRGMRSIQKDIRVILMSGYNQQDATNRFSEKGLAGFIHKPFNPEELIAKMREVMES